MVSGGSCLTSDAMSLIERVEVIDQVAGSDHAMLSVELSWGRTAPTSREQAVSQRAPRLTTAQMQDDFYQLLDTSLPREEVTCWSIEQALSQAASGVPAGTSGLGGLRKQLKAAWLTALRALHTAEGSARTETRRLVRQAGRQYHDVCCVALNRAIRSAGRTKDYHAVWQLIRTAAGVQPADSRRQRIAVKVPTGRLTSSAQEAAATLADHYAGVYQPQDPGTRIQRASASRTYTGGRSIQAWSDAMAELHWASTRQHLQERRGGSDGEVPPPVTMDEVAAACSALRRGTAQDRRGVRSDYLVAHPRLHALLAEVFTMAMRTGNLDPSWLHASITPVLKPNKPTHEVTSYRPVGMTTTLCRAYGHVLLKRLKDEIPDADEPRAMDGAQPVGVSLEQSGFKQRRSCTEAVLALREIISVRWHQGQCTWLLFSDVAKAYDKLDRHRMLHKLELAGVSTWLRRAIAALHSGTTAAVDLRTAQSEPFEVPLGTRQGDVLAPRLYSIAVDHLSTALQTLRDDSGPLGGVELYGERYSGLYFADDVVAVSGCGAGLQSQASAIADLLAMEGLEVSPAKSRVMCVQPGDPRADQALMSLQLYGIPVQVVTSWKHLGIPLTTDLSWSTHIAKAAANGKAARTRLQAMGGKCLAVSTLLQAYTALVRSHTESSATLWCGSDVDTTALDRVDHSSLAWLLGVSGNTPPAILRGELGLRAGRTRREAAALRLYYKLLAGHTQGLSYGCLEHGLREYMTLWRSRRTRRPPNTSKLWLAQIHHILWRVGRCVTDTGPSGEHEASIWIGDAVLDQPDEDEDFSRCYDAAASEIVRRMSQQRSNKVNLAWLWRLDVEEWKAAVVVSPETWDDAASRYISPLYGVIKNRPRLEPYLGDTRQASARRIQTLWRYRGWLHQLPDVRFERRMRCVVCGDANVMDIHWHALSDSGCQDARIVAARDELWAKAGRAASHPATRRMLDKARQSLRLTAGSDPVPAVEMSEAQTLGLRLVLGGWLSKQELGDVPWWPRHLRIARRDASAQQCADALAAVEQRQVDRWAITRAGQDWMMAVDKVVAECID